jgi:hypothetical protein
MLGTQVPAARAQQVVINSTAPYWDVGVRDNALGRACATGHFGMVDPQRYLARFFGAKGAGVLGIAKGDGANLRDPDHRAKPEEDYFFWEHGTSSCQVFVGGRQPATPQQTAAAPAKPQ